MKENKKEKEAPEINEKKEEVKKTEVEVLKEEIEKLKSEINDWKKAYAIKLADFENYKKRVDRDFKEFEKYACQDLVLTQLAEIDTLEKASASTEINDATRGLIDGINMVINNMLEKLKAMGVEEIKGEGIYDPYQHQAMLVENNPNEEEGKILQVLQKGYKLKGKVIRPSMVKINKK